MAAPSRPPIRACELDDGIPKYQVIRFQLIAPISAPKITRGSTMAAVDDAAADGFGHMQAEEQERDEVEERGPGHGILRPQHAGRDDGGDRIRRVVQPVEKIKRQRDEDQRHQQRECEPDVHRVRAPRTTRAR